MEKNKFEILNKTSWLYLNTGVNIGAFNMSFDNYLLQSQINSCLNMPVLRLYGWSEPTISCGKNQILKKSENQILSLFPVVKRITGGSAVLHGTDASELTYSVSLYYEKSARNLYYDLGQVFIYFLERYGLKARLGYSDKDYFSDFNCFNSKTSADIVVGDVKIIGSAQCRKKKYILQHGSIKLDEIKRLSGKNLDFCQAISDLKACFEEYLQIKFLDYSEACIKYEKISNKKEINYAIKNY